MKRFRPAGAVALLLALSSGSALAQVTPGTMVQPMASPDADALANDMRVLGTSPNDVRVLVDAGERALRLGDDTAAGGLFTRVEKIDPNNARMKAGVGTILLHNERPGEALRYYAQAERGGADVTAFASDRGLAYDLIGDQARAQREYRRALARSNDAETTKRYALSLGISGQRDAAVRLLDPLLRSGDRSAWRAQAFVLAMSNDPKGAQKIADTMLPGAMAGGLKPFFARLSTLPAVDRAFAVNFGEVRPSPTRLADARLAPQLPALAVEPVIPATALAANNVSTRPAQKETRAERRRREREERAAVAQASAMPAQRPVQLASATPVRAITPPRTTVSTTTARPGFTTIEPLPASRAAMPTPMQQSGAGVLNPDRTIAVPSVLPQSARSASSSAAAPSVAAVVPAARTPTVAPALTTIAPSAVQLANTAPVRVTPAPSGPALAAVTPPPVVATLGRPLPASSTSVASSEIAVPATGAVAKTESAPRQTAASANANVAAHVVPTVVAPVAKPVEVAKATAKPPKPPHASKRESGDAILARIIAGISVPGSELDVPSTGTRQSSKPVEIAALEPAAKSTRRRGAQAEPAADESQADARSGARRKKADSAADDAGDKRKPGTKAKKDADSASVTADDDKSTKSSSRKKADDKKAADSKAAAKKEEKASPSRIFVQVAGGAQEGDLGKAWDATRKKAPDLFRDKQGYTTPLRATNRVLAGPFKNEDEAQAFINKLSAKGMSGFLFTSDKGQKVDKLPAKGEKSSK